MTTRHAEPRGELREVAVSPRRSRAALERTERTTPSRVVIERVEPQIDGGRFAIKRCVGEPVVVTADVFADGHDQVSAALRFRPGNEEAWSETPMVPRGNDVWEASFTIASQQTWFYSVIAWIDAFRTWRHGFAKKLEAGRVERIDRLVGAELVDQAAGRATKEDARLLRSWAARLRDDRADRAAALDPALEAVVARFPDRRNAARIDVDLRVDVDRERARYSSWYELFPRSTSPVPGRHGTLQDCIARLPYVAEMGFDVLYLAPIHPIGRAHRKGRNNNPQGTPDDVGSPWAIGGPEGGHKAIHPQLGTLDDFHELVGRAGDLGIEVAMDYALQCSPDHPYVAEHPQWFRRRPDGTIQYAENPPKKYEDIYPIDFETEDWRALWEELKSILIFWIGHGVRIFRVDNPHTKPFAFWKWAIEEVRRDHPDVLFLSEAFTRPKVMYRLAKLGFTQSYTYFAWRNTKYEIVRYFTELNGPPLCEYFRPNLWPNTPDILTEPLQYGGRATFLARVTLAATLGASYGIYGPAFELLEREPRQPGSEEYLNAEKYEVRAWDLERADSLRPYLARLNRIRRDNPALQTDRGLKFQPVDNDQIVAFTKVAPDGSNLVLVVVNLDPHHVQSGWVELRLAELGLPEASPYQAHDLLTDAHYFWSGPRNFVRLDPSNLPAHVLRLRRKVRTERDFDYFL
jgi:starch synthase (maltosyl-transferring)